MLKFNRNDLDEIWRKEIDAELELHQWAWAFLRRNPYYWNFQERCNDVYEKILEAQCNKYGNNSELIFAATEDAFLKTFEYEKLKEEYGLVYPEHPDRPAKDIDADIWDSCYTRDEVNFDIEGINPDYQTPIVLDIRKPREIQTTAIDKYLRNRECAEHSSKLRQGNFRLHLDVYDTYQYLCIMNQKEPGYREVSRGCWPDEWAEIEKGVSRASADDKKRLENKARALLKKAKYYVEEKGYFEILRWRPDLKNTKD